MKIDIAGVKVDTVTTEQALAAIDSFVQSGKSHFVVTPYSEMIVFAQNDAKYREALNQADLSIPDGIGILWAAKYLSSANESLLGTLLSILFNPKSIRKIIPEKVTGSSLVYDIALLSAQKQYSLALVGGSGNVAAQAAYELKKLFPELKINLALSGRPFNHEVAKEINETNSDILLIAYSPPRQELWLAENVKKLNSKVAIGLGGTFDYIAGKHAAPPNFMRSVGLEWLWRLITQPWRLKRIWNAVPVFIWKIYKYKLNHHA